MPTGAEYIFIFDRLDLSNTYLNNYNGSKDCLI